jgi:CubicO group peptidase (beta-lactamase class C family)
MRNRTLSFLLALFATAMTAHPDGPSDVARLDTLFSRLFSLGMSPGMSVAVVQGDRIIYARGFGLANVAERIPVTERTTFYIASTTKSLTAFAAALLAHDGTIDLQAPVVRYVPRLRFHPDVDGGAVTVEQALTHTHGISGNGPVVVRSAFTGEWTTEQLLELLAAHGPDRNGRAFTYSNIGYNLAGFVLEAASGRSWKEVVRSRVLQPLGMDRTFANVSEMTTKDVALPYRPSPEGFEAMTLRKTDQTMHEAGGHYSTAHDLAAWVGVHLNEGLWREKRVFPREVVALSHRSHATQDRRYRDIRRFGWGLGWDLGTYEEDTLIHRFGGFAGFHSHVSFSPARRLGVVVLVNAEGLGAVLADGAALAVYDLLSGDSARAGRWKERYDAWTVEVPKSRADLAVERRTRAERPGVPEEQFSLYVGRYRSAEYGTIHVTARQRRLGFAFGQLTSDGEAYDASKHQFRVELTGSGSVISFNVENGQAAALQFQGIVFRRE